MPKIKTNDICTYYEINGQGSPLIFIHGAWASHEVWGSQVEYFSDKYEVITYDLRGHGKTGGAITENYTTELLADDLATLVDALSVEYPCICGLSLGGLVAQIYSVKYLDNINALMLADTAISSAHTLSHLLLRYVLLPKHSLFLMIRTMGLERYISFIYELAKAAGNENWLGLTEEIREYFRKEILKFGEEDFIKILEDYFEENYHLSEIIRTLSDRKLPANFVFLKLIAREKNLDIDDKLARALFNFAKEIGILSILNVATYTPTIEEKLLNFIRNRGETRFSLLEKRFPDTRTLVLKLWRENLIEIEGLEDIKEELISFEDLDHIPIDLVSNKTDFFSIWEERTISTRSNSFWRICLLTRIYCQPIAICVA